MANPKIDALLKDVPLGPHKNGIGGRRAYLKAWELDFAEWYARQPIRPSLKEQVEKAQELTQRFIGERYLLGLKQRQVWKDYITKLNTDQITSARLMLERRYPRGVEAHFQALEGLMEAKQYDKIAALTVPVLDRVAPKKQEATQVTAINITLSPAQQQAMDAEVIDITAVKMLPSKTE